VTRRLLIVGAAAAAVAAALALGGLATRDVSGSDRTRPDTAALHAGFAAGDTRALVATLQDELRSRPRNVRGLGLLGLAYQQRARETGDPSYYGLSERALTKALRIAPRDLDSATGLAALALSRHRFREALELGERARSLSPSTAASYGVIGDALVELGRYTGAFDAFDTMVRLKPSVASYARVAYARELLGRTDSAREALLLARDAAAGRGEPTAWTETQLGKLELSRGRYAAAASRFDAALRAFPGYVYAFDGLAQVAAARGDFARAIALERRAVAAMPLPQFVGYLGDLYRVSGRAALARRQYATVDGIRRLFVASGVRTDLETASFDVDHGLRLRQSLALARRAHAERPSIDGDDLLAWALARNDRCEEALPWSKRALRLGTRDATKLFHRAYVEHCLGRDARPWARRALALNPHFSLLWSATARRLAS
jgi:tetratricopeptide (TPR) repeat protein